MPHDPFLCHRRTKIIATLGPASASPDTLSSMVRAGLDVVRFNLSHGTLDDHRTRLEALRDAAQASGRTVGILFDLRGPKLRIEGFSGGRTIELVQGAPFSLDAECPADGGDESCVGIRSPDLVSRVQPGRRIALDDGRILLEVETIEGSRILCRVVAGGTLGGRKGVHLIGGGLAVPGLTAEDRAHLVELSKIDPEYIGLSFVRDARDIREARALLSEHGSGAGVIAKIERYEALQNIEEIIEIADGIMVARGDLGVEVGNARLPGYQKRLIQMARGRGRIAIVATEMMESMTQNTRPYRAEVFDVANAVLDGTDAMMLSAETAVGRYPVRVIEAAGEICAEAERDPKARTSQHRLRERFRHAEETIAMSAMYAANHHYADPEAEDPSVHAIVALTESGHTVLLMSRIDSGVPIFAATDHAGVCGRVTLYRGVYPIHLGSEQGDLDSAEKVEEALKILVARGLLARGNEVLVTRGVRSSVSGGTDTLQVMRVS